MKDKLNMHFAAGLGFCLFWIGGAFFAAKTDMPIRTEPEKFGYMTSVTVAILTLTPFALGFIAGKKDGE